MHLHRRLTMPRSEIGVVSADLASPRGNDDAG